MTTSNRTPDSFGRRWPESYELCDDCGQPDNCGECTHVPLSDGDVAVLLSWEEATRALVRSGDTLRDRSQVQ